MSRQMTSRERMLCALERGKPDRLPVSIHQWQKYHLEEHLGGIGDLEAFDRVGMDAQIQYFGDVGQIQEGSASLEASSSNWRIEADVKNDDPDDRIIHYAITTPEGTLTYKTGGNRKTTWVTEYMVKRDEDIELIDKYMPVPKLNLAEVSRLHDEVGDRGILRGFVWGDQAGCWQHAACLMDINDLIVACFDKPDWVHRFMEALLAKKMVFIESMKGAKFDLVETGGGAASSTVISPTLHEEFCTPYDRKMHDALHDLGFKVAYHTCGGTLGIEELIIANGCDASETLAPKSIGTNQEPWEFADKVHHKLALIGGMDQFSVVSDGSKEYIREKVFELFEKIGREGGYICALSDHFFETPVENLKIFADAAKECVY